MKDPLCEPVASMTQAGGIYEDEAKLPAGWRYLQVLNNESIVCFAPDGQLRYAWHSYTKQLHTYVQHFLPTLFNQP